MKNLIEHFLNNNTEEVVAKSLKNCHAIGLYSIMLLDSPGKTIRLYIATPGNELYKNYEDRAFSDNLSVAFHPHHCDLTLQVLHGQLHNRIVVEKPGENIRKFIYSSKIKTGKIHFTDHGLSSLEFKESQFLNAGTSIKLSAKDIHTVACAKDRVTAWIVFEGKSDPDYVSFCWSNHDLTKADFSEYYQPMDEALIRSLVDRIDF